MYGNGYGKQGRGGNRPQQGNYNIPPGNFGQMPVAEMQFDMNSIPIPPPPPPMRSIDFNVEEGKGGKIGKVSIFENPRQETNAKAPKFNGEVKLGDYVFEISLWPNSKKEGDIICYSGPIKRKRGNY